MAFGRTVALALFVAPWAVSCSGEVAHELAGDERLQVSLFWGGGEPRVWEGVLRVEAPELEWVWLTDFEEGDRVLAGDRFPAPAQWVPSGWRRSKPADFARRAPANGAVLATTTAGEADGLLFELRGSPAAGLALDLGDGARLEATIERLLAGPVLVPADASGNVLLAQAIDLRADAPLATPVPGNAGLLAQRVSLHDHSCFSTNETLLDPVVESLRPFVRTVWWTDHNIARERAVLAGDFEDEDLVRRYWLPSTEDARLASAGVEPDAYGGERGYRLEARATSARTGRAWIELAGGHTTGHFQAALCIEPVLRWAWKPLLAGADDADGDGGGAAASVAFVELHLHSGRTLRYWSGETALFDPASDVVVESAVGEWRSVARDVQADARALYGDYGTDALGGATFGVLCPPGETGRVLFDEIALDTPPPAEVIRIQEERFHSFDAVRSHMGMEDSYWIGPRGFGPLVPHLSHLVPSRAAEVFGAYDEEPTLDERRAAVRATQAAGGCVGAHHLQMEEHFEAFMEAAGFGVDLFEIGGGNQVMPCYGTPEDRRDRDAHGYPELAEDEVYPLLVRWDRLTARGLFLTGYGAPDLHQHFHRPNSGWLNRWLTTILAPDDDPATLLRELRNGQAVASEWRTAALVTLAVDGRPWMGKVVATDRGRHRVTASVSGALPGSRLRWIRGELARALPSSEGTEPGVIGRAGEVRVDAAETEAALEVDAGRGVFVRAELLNPAGHLVALSNPVVFLPYWPQRWPAGKVAFDWGGVSLAGQAGVLLDEARLAEDGTLELGGTAGASGGELALRAEGLGAVGGSGGWREEREGDLVRLRDVPAGRFALTLETPPSSSREPERTAVPRADPLALPERNELFFHLDVGIPSSEEGRGLEGFDAPARGVLGNLHLRAVRPGRPARFRLPVPAGERVLLKLRVHKSSGASGRVLMDGAELGRLERMSARTIEIPPADPGSDAVVERTFEIVLDPAKPPLREFDLLLLKRVELWRGDGVVDY